MAAHVVNDPLAGGDTRAAHQEPGGGGGGGGGGTSYAHAVLNFKNTDANSNKENINEDGQIRPPATVKNDTPKEMPNDAIDDGDSFTPVVNHSRKERKNERNRREKLKENNHKQQQTLVNGNGERKEFSMRDHSDKEKDREAAAVVVEKDAKPKVFVEAPLPKVNPWQNRNAAKSLGATEKRVLQPPKQETTVNCQAPVAAAAAAVPAAVAAPRQKRRYNQKVSFFRNKKLIFLNKKLKKGKFFFCYKYNKKRLVLLLFL